MLIKQVMLSRRAQTLIAALTTHIILRILADPSINQEGHKLKVAPDRCQPK